MIARPLALAMIAATLLATPARADERPAFAPVYGETRGPIGWFDFCARLPQECASPTTSARAPCVLSPACGGETERGKPRAPAPAASPSPPLRDVARINALVNAAIVPMSDIDHYGVAERWAYPDDGFGDCEDFALLKRRLLMRAGWPRASLLITIVRDERDAVHAVLTVATDRGDVVLDNRTDAVRLWSDTSYRFVKRQSPDDPNRWFALDDDARPITAVAAQGASQ